MYRNCTKTMNKDVLKEMKANEENYEIVKLRFRSRSGKAQVKLRKVRKVRPWT